MQLRKVGDWIWEIPPEGGMRVPGRIYSDGMPAPDDPALQQVRWMTSFDTTEHDVERFDREPQRPLLHGLIGEVRAYYHYLMRSRPQGALREAES